MRLNLSFIALPKDAAGSRPYCMNVILVRLRILIMNLFITFDPEERDVRDLLPGDKQMHSNGLASSDPCYWRKGGPMRNRAVVQGWSLGWIIQQLLVPTTAVPITSIYTTSNGHYLWLIGERISWIRIQFLLPWWSPSNFELAHVISLEQSLRWKFRYYVCGIEHVFIIILYDIAFFHACFHVQTVA